MNELLQDFTNKSIEILNKNRNSLNQIADKIIDELENRLKELPSITNFTISGRVKGNDSLREKIIRKNYYVKYKEKEELFLEELPDIIGIRITCFLNNEEIDVYNNIDLFKIF